MDNKTVLFVYPRKAEEQQTLSSDLSLALLYLSGAVREMCDQIAVFDYNVHHGEDGQSTGDARFADILQEMKPSVVAINCLYSGIFPHVLDTVSQVKAFDPLIKIVVGGLHPTIFAEEIIANCPSIDTVMLGEGDVTLPKLLRYFWNEASEDELSGVVLRTGGTIVKKPLSGYIDDLDTLSMPGYEFFDLSKYQFDTKNWYDPRRYSISRTQIPILTSRSCPNQCSFCAMRLVMGIRFRPRSAENVVAEIQHIYNTYGINYFKIMDDNFSFNRERAVDICDGIIKSGMKVYFETPNGLMIRKLDEELLGIMKEAGFIRVSLAIESGSEFIRNRVLRKNITEKQIYDVFAWCKKMGMITKALFMIGLPQETENSILKTETMIRNLDCDHVLLSRTIPFPGTKLFEECKKNDLFLEKFDYGRLWSGEFALSDLSVHGMKSTASDSENRFFLKPYALTVEELKAHDFRLRTLIDEKTKAWRKHVQTTNALTED